MSDQRSERIQELYEIADGAYGDGPWMRGAAKERLRKMGLPFPALSPSPTSVMPDEGEGKS